MSQVKIFRYIFSQSGLGKLIKSFIIKEKKQEIYYEKYRKYEI